jgi:hypothetical protein
MAIQLCERCYAPIDTTRERYTTFAHIDHALPDGGLAWVHSAVHVAPCGATTRERSAAEPPDRGEWDAARRGHSPAAAAWIARRSAGVRTP